MRYFLICNPGSRNFKSKAICEKYISELKNRNVDFSYCFTKSMEDIEGLVAEGIENNFDVVVAVGGDGTINRVLNGILTKDNASSLTKFGVLYSGTSPDFCKYHSIPISHSKAIDSLLSGVERPIDICKIEHLDNLGSDTLSYFASSSNIGLGAGIASRSNRNRKRLGDFAGTLFAAVTTIAKSTSFSCEIIVDGKSLNFENVLNVSVGKNPHIASGLKLNLNIAPDDGRMFLFVIHGISKPKLIFSLSSAYSGKISENKSFVMIEVGSSVEVIPNKPKIEVEYDGDPWGYCPTRITLMKSKIRLVGGDV